MTAAKKAPELEELPGKGAADRGAFEQIDFDAKAPKLEVRDRLGIVGPTGSGKGRLAKAWIPEWMKDRLVVALDPMDEHSLDGVPGKWRELGRLPDRVGVLDVDAQLIRRSGGIAVVVESARRGEEIADALDYLLDTLEHETEAVESRNGVILVLDELGRYFREAQPAIEDVLTGGRQWGISVVCIAQRMVQIPATARAQLNQLVAFQQDSPLDVKAIAEWQGERFASEVQALSEGAALHWRRTPPEGT